MKLPVSFKLSLILHFVAVATLPMLLLGVFGFHYFEKKHIETVSGLIDHHSLVVGQEASEFLKDTNDSLFQISKVLESGLLQSDAEINRYLQMAVEGLPTFESIYLLDKRKTITHFGLSGKDVVAREDYIGLDLSGHDIFSGHPTLSGKAWSNTFLSAITVEPSITLGFPVEGGFLLGTVSLQKLSTQLSERLKDTSRNFQFSLLDHHGFLIADSRPALVTQRLNMRSHPEVRNALDNQVGVTSKYHEDLSRLESVQLVPETGWAAYVSLPVEEAMQGFAPLRFMLLASLVFAAVVGIVLSLWLSRRLLRPIIFLRDAARNVAQGNYHQILQPAHYAELEDLSQGFRDMVDAVEEREQSIRNSQDRYRSLVDSIDGIVWEMDLAEFRFTFVSDQAEQFLGYPAQRWLDEKDFWQDHIHDDDRDWVVSFCASETAAQRDHDFEYRMVASDGRAVWLKDVVSVICEEGSAVRLRGVMLDVTPRKEAELVLRETSTRLEMLIERMPYGCIVWGAEGRVELWNPAAEKIFGYSSAEVCGLCSFEFLVAAELQDTVQGIFERISEGGSQTHSINENLTKDGRTIVCEWHNTPWLNADGEMQGFISIVQDVTERIAAEKALKESETRFRTIFQTNPDAVLISRLCDGQILSANKNCQILSGYSDEELLGSPELYQVLWTHPEDRDSFRKTLRESGVVDNREIMFNTKSGRTRIGLTSACVLRLNDEDCILTVIRDITGMKEAEARMVRSESRFRSLVSVMGEGLIILGYNGEVVQCNQAAERILKLSAEDIIGKLYDELIHEAFSEEGALLEPTQHPAVFTLDTGKPVLNMIMGIPQRGSQMAWLQVNSHALGLDKNGKPVAVVLSFADVSRLKHIETELRSNEKNLQTLSQQFRGVLEAIPDQIMVLDQEMRMVWLNRQLGSGLSAQVESAGIPCCEIPDVLCSPIAAIPLPCCDSCPIKRSFETRSPQEAQWGVTGGMNLSLRAFPVFNEEDELVNVIGIVQDVTEAVRHQAQVMRTGQLAALGELAAGVAHEINNPINGVINYAQLILNKAVEASREQELSQRIIRESERVATIVKELLYFAREESQEIHIIEVSTALDDALALIQNPLNKEGVLLQINLQENLPRIVSRSHQIQQLFLNLISNARHALSEKYPGMDEDKILQIKAEQIQDNDKSSVRITFRDHGCGIDAKLLSRVLNPFVTTKAAGEGTGLGLSISHEIVQKHEGTLSIDSVHGEFTEVVVELPVSK